MPIEVIPHVSPSLHPAAIEQLDGFDQDTSPYVASAQTAMSSAYLAIESIHKARAQALKNTALTPDMITLRVADYAEKKQTAVLKELDSARVNLHKAIKATDDMLQTPLEQQSGAGSINTEIRAHFKGLSTGDRVKLIAELNEKADDKSLTAILGAPAYLSGLSDVEHGLYLRQFHERKNPAAAKRLKVMRQAHDLLEQRGPLVFGEITKSVFGNEDMSNWKKVEQLRQVRKATDDAFNV